MNTQLHSHVFSSKSSIVLLFTFKSVIYFELILVSSVILEVQLHPFVCESLSTTCWKDYSFIIKLPLHLYRRSCVHAKTLHSCSTLCNPMDCSSPGFSVHGILRQEYWRGLPCPPLRYLPYPGIEPSSLTPPALAGGFFTTSATWEVPIGSQLTINVRV